MIASVLSPSTCSLINNASALEDQRIRQAQMGNLDAFNELVLTYQDRVFCQALWLLNDEAEAEDASQEAFLLAYRNIHTYRFQGTSFRAWILRITTNCCLDHLRAAKRRPCQPLETVNEDGDELEPAWLRDSGDTPETVVERSELGDRISHAIQGLACEYRMAVVLVDLQELDYAEACAILHIPLGTFKSRLARARAKLRKELSKMPYAL